MPSSIAPSARRAQAERLAERIREHKEEAIRLREELGDPEQALFRFISERFEAPALIPGETAEPGVSRAVGGC